MILIVTSKGDMTADYAILAMQDRQVAYLRFNTEDFPSKVKIRWPLGGETGLIEVKGKEPVRLDQIESVWYRRPALARLDRSGLTHKPRVFVREESWQTLQNLWDHLDCSVWMSRPQNIAASSHKLHQLKLARECGFTVPDSLVSNDVRDLLDFFDRHGGKVVIKSIQNQTQRVMTDYSLFTVRVARDELTEEACLAPILMQEEVSKARELRVTVVGEQVFSCALYSQESEQAVVDWRRATSEVRHEAMRVSADIERKLLKMTHDCGLTFGAFDLIETPSGDIVFVELNPNGQWAWIEQMTQLPIREAIVDVLAAR